MTTLRNILFINGVSSGLTGLLLVTLPDFVAGLFEATQSLPFFWVGAFLVAFGSLVVFTAMKKQISVKSVNLIIVLDASWIVASLGIIVLQALNLSFLGYVLIAGVAAWVGLMLYLQVSGLKQLTNTRSL